MVAMYQTILHMHSQLNKCIEIIKKGNKIVL